MKCSNHNWPQNFGGNFRSYGSVERAQCNNCFAQKIIFSWSTWINNKNETKHTKEVIIEDPR